MGTGPKFRADGRHGETQVRRLPERGGTGELSICSQSVSAGGKFMN